MEFELYISPSPINDSAPSHWVNKAKMVSQTAEYTTIVSGDHGRERRLERNLEKIDLKRAKRYGMAEPSRHGRIKYTYGGIVLSMIP